MICTNQGDDPQLVKDKIDVLREAEAFALKYKGSIAQLEISEFKTMLQDYEVLQDKAWKNRVLCILAMEHRYNKP